jgi:putative ABC transport system ATP-binding protein
MIIGSDLRRYYGLGAVQVRALDGVSLKIQKGEFVGVMGPSGSGKSTLLHLLGLLDRPTSGSLLIDGIDVGALDEHERTVFRLRRLGYVFQDYALVPELTAQENVFLPSMARGMTAQECTLVCSDILGVVGLGDRIHHLPSQMSGGEQQRVAIARALVNDPQVVVADEPTAHLDRRLAEELLVILEDIHRDGRTVVIATHDPRVFEHPIVDRILEMRDGRIVGERRS